MENNESTPSLVGANVRNVTDHDEYDKDVSRIASPAKSNQRLPFGHDDDTSEYTSVNELADEGALINDEQEYGELLDATGKVVPNVSRATPVITGVQDDTLSTNSKEKLIELSIPQPVEIDDKSHTEFVVVDIAAHHPSVDVADAATPTEGSGTPSIYELKNTDSGMSLEDLIDSQLASMSSFSTDLQKRVGGKKKPSASVSRSRSRLRNVVESAVPDSVIENDAAQQVPAGAREGMASPLVQSRSQSKLRTNDADGAMEKPHLARGDSYSGVHTYESRPGRRSDRDGHISALSSRDYLRSVSRSRSRVGKETPVSNEELAEEGALMTDDLDHEPEMIDRIDFKAEALEEEDGEDEEDKSAPSSVKDNDTKKAESTSTKSIGATDTADATKASIGSQEDSLDEITRKLEDVLNESMVKSPKKATPQSPTMAKEVEVVNVIDEDEETEESKPTEEDAETADAETADAEVKSEDQEDIDVPADPAKEKVSQEEASEPVAEADQKPTDSVVDSEEVDKDVKATEDESLISKATSSVASTAAVTATAATAATASIIAAVTGNEETEAKEQAAIDEDAVDATTEGIIEPSHTEADEEGDEVTTALEKTPQLDAEPETLNQNSTDDVNVVVDAVEEESDVPVTIDEDETEPQDTEGASAEVPDEVEDSAKSIEEVTMESKTAACESKDLEEIEAPVSKESEATDDGEAESTETTAEATEDIAAAGITDETAEEEVTKSTDDNGEVEAAATSRQKSTSNAADETERLINELEAELGELSMSTTGDYKKANENELDTSVKKVAVEAVQESADVPVESTEDLTKEVKTEEPEAVSTEAEAVVEEEHAVEEEEEELHEPTKEEIIEMLKDEPVYLYTSLAGGGFFMPQRTNTLVTILTANRIPFTYRDLGTDEEARNVWRRYSKGRTLPGIVRGKDDIIGNWEEIQEANEDYRVRELIYETL